MRLSFESENVGAEAVMSHLREGAGQEKDPEACKLLCTHSLSHN